MCFKFKNEEEQRKFTKGVCLINLIAYGCFALMFLVGPIRHFTVKTYELNTLDLGHSALYLNTSKRSEVEVKAGEFIYFKIAKEQKRNFTQARGFYMELLKNTGSNIHVYLCSKNYGAINDNSICGRYKYEEL